MMLAMMMNVMGKWTEEQMRAHSFLGCCCFSYMFT